MLACHTSQMNYIISSALSVVLVLVLPLVITNGLLSTAANGRVKLGVGGVRGRRRPTIPPPFAELKGYVLHSLRCVALDSHYYLTVSPFQPPGFLFGFGFLSFLSAVGQSYKMAAARLTSRPALVLTLSDPRLLNTLNHLGVAFYFADSVPLDFQGVIYSAASVLGGVCGREGGGAGRRARITLRHQQLSSKSPPAPDHLRPVARVALVYGDCTGVVRSGVDQKDGRRRRRRRHTAGKDRSESGTRPLRDSKPPLSATRTPHS